MTGIGEPDASGFRTATLMTDSAGELGEALLGALIGAGWRVRAISRSHPTLEDVFLAATRRSWDTVDAAKK